MMEGTLAALAAGTVPMSDPADAFPTMTNPDTVTVLITTYNTHPGTLVGMSRDAVEELLLQQIPQRDRDIASSMLDELSANATLSEACAKEVLHRSGINPDIFLRNIARSLDEKCQTIAIKILTANEGRHDALVTVGNREIYTPTSSTLVAKALRTALNPAGGWYYDASEADVQSMARQLQDSRSSLTTQLRRACQKHLIREIARWEQCLSQQTRTENTKNEEQIRKRNIHIPHESREAISHLLAQILGPGQRLSAQLATGEDRLS